MSVSDQSAASFARPVEIPELEIRAELQRIKSSRVFADAIKLQNFLTYVVDETLAGRADRIKGYSVARDVFHRENPEDSQTSTIVRVEAGRLRRRLIEYYSDEGRTDTVRFEIPKGGYVPRFCQVSVPADSDHGQIWQEDRGELDANQKAVRSRRHWTRVAAIIAGIVFLALWLGEKMPGSASNDGRPVLTMTTPSIVVLPFTSESGGELEAELAEGLTEDIVTDLSKIQGIDVIALPSAIKFAGGELRPSEVGSQLGVSYVLKGSVRGNYPKTRITAHLFDSKSNRQLWAGRFDRDASDMLAVQDELAGRVVEGMSAGLTAAIADVPRSLVAGEARALYRQAMDLANPPGDKARLAAAKQAFVRAIEIDSHYSRAIAGLAYVYVFNVLFGHSAVPDDDIEQSRQLAAEALSLDQTVGLAYTTMAFQALIEADQQGALDMSTKAISVQPSDPYLNTYHAYFLAMNGQAAAGIPYAEHALRLDPLNTRSPFMNILGFVSFYADDYQGAHDAYVSNRDRGGPFSAGHHTYIVASLAALGMRDEALIQLKILDEQGGMPVSTGGPLVDRFKDTEDRKKLTRIISQL